MLTSPAFKAAEKACAKLGFIGANLAAQSENATDSVIAACLGVAKCMRAHGVPNLPDPRTTMPSNPASYGSVANMNGVIWAIPKSIDLQAPAVKHAAATCNAQAVIATG